MARYRMYNAITRAIEPELVPCCRKLGLRIVIYNPIAYVLHPIQACRIKLFSSGGFFAGKIQAPDAETPSGGRFDPSSAMGKMYQARYFKQGYFDALKLLQAVAVRSQISVHRYRSNSRLGEKRHPADVHRPTLVSTSLAPGTSRRNTHWCQ